ncbi:MAG: hypothetical protein Q9180_009477, partial [Flavoplaca navasiana]
MMTRLHSISSEEWACKALHNPQWQEPEEQAAVGTIRDLCEGKITSQIAATNITSIYEARVKNGNAELWNLWTAVFDAIHHLGHNINHLTLVAEMARCISRLPAVVDLSGEPIKAKTRAQVFWRDMPGFAYCFSEIAVDQPYLEDLDRELPLDRNNAIQKLLNSNIFGAIYLTKLDPDGPWYDFWYFRTLARDHLMYALELATETYHQIRRAGIYLPAAAMWILIAGQNIHNYCKVDQDYKGKD